MVMEKNLKRIGRFLILQLALAACQLHGQEATQPDPAKKDVSQLDPDPPDAGQKHSTANQFLRDTWTDQKAIWTSPIHMNRHQFFTIALPLAVVTAGLVATDERAADELPNSRDQIKWSGRVSQIGAAYTLGGMVGGLLVAGKIAQRPGLFRMGRNSAEALANAIVVSSAIKWITLRERPDQGDGDGSFWHGGVSFPSGHAMDSWAMATAMARTPKCPKWLAITSYAVATAVSLSRWGARKHFPSDIVVGSALGGLVGNYVARRPR